MTASSPWRRLVALLAVGAALSAFVSACGDDSDSGSSATTAASSDETGSPEDVIVPDAEVTAGLNQSITDMHARGLVRANLHQVKERLATAA